MVWSGKSWTFFSFGTKFWLSTHLAIISIDAWGSKVHLSAPNTYYVKRRAVWLLHADLPHRQTLNNLYQEWCCWRKRNWGDVCEMENLELQFPYTTRRANSGTKFPQFSRQAHPRRRWRQKCEFCDGLRRLTLKFKRQKAFISISVRGCQPLLDGVDRRN